MRDETIIPKKHEVPVNVDHQDLLENEPDIPEEILKPTREYIPKAVSA